jgi:REP element-mobilizing transposase RayT
MKPKRLPSPPYNPGVRDLVHGLREGAGPQPQADKESGFLGWHEHGYLPHRDEPGRVQFVTFRLADAFPLELRGEWEDLLKIEDDRKKRLELERYLDKGRGKCHLKNPEIALIVENSLKFKHPTEYELHAWVIMPNHVHVLFLVKELPMSEVVGGWKSFTAREANKVLQRKGQFWQDEYWDTYMRDEDHEARTRRYIEKNPTKAMLVAATREWPWSSARWRDDFERLVL